MVHKVTLVVFALSCLLARVLGDQVVVTAAGSLQKAAGCPGNWDPSCPNTALTPPSDSSDIWRLSLDLSAGEYQYKIVLGKTWEINFGKLGTPGGENLGFSLSSPRKVNILYDQVTRSVADDVSYLLFVVIGDFQTNLGCPSNWNENCLHVLLEQLDDGTTVSRQVTGIPAGTYSFKLVPINEPAKQRLAAIDKTEQPNHQFEKVNGDSKVRFSFSFSLGEVYFQELKKPSPRTAIASRETSCLGTPTWDKLIMLRSNSTIFGQDAPLGGWWVTGIHANYLPRSGHVLITGWVRQAHDTCPKLKTRKKGVTFILDPASLTLRTEDSLFVESINEKSTDDLTVYDAATLYCAGHNTLSDGNIFFVGGGKYKNLGGDNELEYGLDYGRIFDTTKKSFEIIPQKLPSSFGTAWYPTHLQLPDERVLIIGGFAVCCRGDVDANNGILTFDPKEYKKDPINGKYWEMLYRPNITEFPELIPGIRDYVHTVLLPKPKIVNEKSYQVLMIAKAGVLVWFNTDPNPEGFENWSEERKKTHERSRFLIQDNSQAHRGAYDGAKAMDSTAMLLPNNKLMVFGGGFRPQCNALDVFDLVTGEWEPSVESYIGRRVLSSVMLPDGTVLLINGMHPDGDGAPFDAQNDQRQPVIYDPYTKRVTELDPWADDPKRRGYHSFAMLLKDGRVLIGGGTLSNEGIGCERPDVRIFTPPYLSGCCSSRPSFLAKKELVLNPPVDGSYHLDRVQIAVADAAIIRKDRGVVLLAPASQTHSFNQHQAYIPLKFEVKNQNIIEVFKDDDNVIVYGFYTMFLISEDGVPSEGIVAKVEVSKPTEGTNPDKNSFKKLMFTLGVIVPVVILVVILAVIYFARFRKPQSSSILLSPELTSATWK